ncbi:MAG: hypothetical protein HGGPFJEG_01388 [Ignavibacteria bacterium]|nr:hypothetical protein [Ignavibacteria bacterium]
MTKNFAMKKLYYSISEVSRITELEQYVLRYWETEFEQLNPAKNHSGNRIYTNKDIKLILYIKKLLREEKYTIEGAKKLIRNYSIKEQEKENIKPQTSQPETMRLNKSGITELSLFEHESNQSNNELSKNENLKEDLLQIKIFLENLLDELK